MLFSIINRLDIGKYEWDKVANASEEGWLWHLYDFQEVIKADGWEDIGFGIADQFGRILCIFPLQIKSKYIFAKLKTFGPALLSQFNDEEAKIILDFIKIHITQLAKSYSAYEIYFTLPALAPNQRENRIQINNSLLILGCEDMRSQTYIINLRKTEEQIWNKMEARCRTAIRKAQKNGYEIVRANSEASIEVYYNLHLKTYKRTGARPHTFEYFKLIWELFRKNEMANLFFAVKGGKYIAGQLIISFKRSAFYASGASELFHAKMGVNNLLQWHAIRWAKENGCDWFESGEAFPHMLKGKMKGINDFKRSFGGELYPYYKGQIVFKPFLKSVIDFIHDKKVTQIIRKPFGI